MPCPISVTLPCVHALEVDRVPGMSADPAVTRRWQELFSRGLLYPGQLSAGIMARVESLPALKAINVLERFERELEDLRSLSACVLNVRRWP